MIVRNVARFQSTLPEDFIETDDGEDFVQPPGKSVADAMVIIFRDLGFEVNFGPEPVSDFVWGIGVGKGRRRFRVGLNLAHEYHLTFTNPSWTDWLLGREPVAFLALLLGCSRALAGDERFSNVRWFTGRGTGEGFAGADTPWEVNASRKARLKSG